MVRKRTTRGPQFTFYFNDVLEALNALGGSGSPNEVVEKILETRSTVSDNEAEILSDGTQRIVKNIHWARFYLVKAGLVDGATRGIWLLTDVGRGAMPLTADQTLELFTLVQSQLNSQRGKSSQISEATDNPEVTSAEQVELLERLGHREIIRSILLNLPPAGFERFCQYLLRKSGFEEVTVTGKVGDGGIDGIGDLVINPFVRFKIAFQCKRYKGSIGSEIVRNFRGSIQGRADKGLILTTGTFSPDARREAKRDGAIPIELVDGEKLIDLMEQLGFGLKSEQIPTYKVDTKFFDAFQTN
jgi:restriction system protein